MGVRVVAEVHSRGEPGFEQSDARGLADAARRELAFVDEADGRSSGRLQGGQELRRHALERGEVAPGILQDGARRSGQVVDRDGDAAIGNRSGRRGGEEDGREKRHAPNARMFSRRKTSRGRGGRSENLLDAGRDGRAVRRALAMLEPGQELDPGIRAPLALPGRDQGPPPLLRREVHEAHLAAGDRSDPPSHVVEASTPPGP